MKSLGRPRHRSGDNITVEHKEIGWDGVDWIHMAQDKDKWRAHVNAVMRLLFL
jgi:hypothetical protein